jgi:hypothetical protein
MASPIALFQVNVDVFRATATTDFTKGNFIKLCHLLKKSFADKHEFEPYAITEGGILFESTDGIPCSLDRIKCMKLYGITQNGTYGWIKRGVTLL